MATSNFIDTATIWLHAGKGGDGAVTFHREKFVAAGGPDGGDGGRGGDIIFVADDNLSTLMDFRYKRKYVAENGVDGQGGRKSGKDGANLVIRVPRGTLVRDAETNEIIQDMSGSEPYVLCKGGRGGWGNQHFATPTRQVPRFAKAGYPGESREVVLELKLLADVGLVCIKPQFGLQPDIDLPFFHVPALLQMLQRPVSQDSFVPEIPICQSPHRPVCPVMGTHIGITSRPAITEIEKFSLRAPVVPIYNTSGAKRSVGVTVWAFNFF